MQSIIGENKHKHQKNKQEAPDFSVLLEDNLEVNTLLGENIDHNGCLKMMHEKLLVIAHTNRYRVQMFFQSKKSSLFSYLSSHMGFIFSISMLFRHFEKML